MPETKHTPGPWVAVESCEGCLLPSGVAIAVQTAAEPWLTKGRICHMVGQGDGHYEPDVTTANANLIAAAPELLAACVGLIDALTCINAVGHPGLCGDVTSALAAIAKVKGGAK